MSWFSRSSLCLLIVVLVGHVSSRSRLGADDATAARDVIAKAIKAHGGQEKLTKLPAQSWKETGTFYGMGQEFPYVGMVWVHAPNRVKVEIENVYTVAIDGDRGWVNAQGSIVDLPQDQVDESKEQQYGDWVATLVPLKDSEFKLSLIGDATVENKPAVGVRVSRKDHRDVNLYFDKETSLLVRSEKRVKVLEQGGEEVTQEATFGEFETVEGIKVPKKSVTKRDGKPYLDATRSEIARSEKLDDGLFAKP